MPRKLTPEHYDFVNEERAAWDKSRNARRIRQMAREQNWSNAYTEYRQNSAFANFLKKKLEKSEMTSSNAYRNFEANLGLLKPRYIGKNMVYLTPEEASKQETFEAHAKTFKSFIYSKTSTPKGVSRAREKAIEKIKKEMAGADLLGTYGAEIGRTDKNAQIDWSNIDLDADQVIDFFDAFRTWKQAGKYGSQQVLEDYSKFVEEHGKDKVDRALSEMKDEEKAKIKQIRDEVKKGVKDVTLRTSAEEFFDTLERIINRNDLGESDTSEVGDRL